MNHFTTRTTRYFIVTGITNGRNTKIITKRVRAKTSEEAQEKFLKRRSIDYFNSIDVREL